MGIEIDVRANTGDTERALLGLVGDVDKLISRAKKLQERGERARKQDRADLREQRLYQRKPAVDVKVINNNINDLGNSLNNLTER